MRHRGLSALLGVSVVLAVMLATSGGTSAAVGVAFTVDSAADSSDMNVGNGICATAAGACTLRAAIQESNASVGSKDTVAFALATPPFSIAPVTELPAITDPVEIDGTTQPGFVDRPIVDCEAMRSPRSGTGGFGSVPETAWCAASSSTASTST